MSERSGTTIKSVYSLSRPSRCYGCDQKLMPGNIVTLKNSEQETEVLCRTCSGLDTLEALPSGNAVVTRLAKKYSKEKYVIMQWSSLWKCYERVGLLVEPQAIERARKESSSASSSSP